MIGSTMTVERVANGWVVRGGGHTYVAHTPTEVRDFTTAWTQSTEGFTREATPFDPIPRLVPAPSWLPAATPTTDGA